MTHIVDRLAEVRLQIKALQEAESALKIEISRAIGTGCQLDGEDWVVFQSLTARKGGLDEAALKAAGVDVDAFRKPETAVLTLRTAPRVSRFAA